MTTEELRAVPHIALVEPFGDPVYLFRVTMEDGYCIRTPRLDELVYKTVTIVYPTDSIDDLVIIPTTELPEGAELCGDTGNDQVTE